MTGLAKALILCGLAVAGVGVLILLAGRLPWLGNLPGDISVDKPGFSFYFPITTCIVISLVISLLLKFFGK